MTLNGNPGALARAAGAEKPIQEPEEGFNSKAYRCCKKKSGTPYVVMPSASEPFRVILSGRARWALDRLRMAGPNGCTPLTEPAPRWSAYVFSLRQLGIEVETVTETHGGEFAGHHARYVLRSRVAIDWIGGVA